MDRLLSRVRYKPRARIVGEQLTCDYTIYNNGNESSVYIFVFSTNEATLKQSMHDFYKTHVEFVNLPTNG